MRKREDLKVGDKVIAIYYEGYGNPGTAYEVEIEKITKDRISVKSVGGKNKGVRMDFTNDDKMCHVSLLYSNFQHCNLFLGDANEAKKADDDRVEQAELYLEAQELFEGLASDLTPSSLRKIIHILKKSQQND